MFDPYIHQCTLGIELDSCLLFQPVSATGSAPEIISPSSSKDFKDFEDELNANREIVSFLQIKLDELTKELESRYKNILVRVLTRVGVVNVL